MVKQANHRGAPARPPCRQAQRSEAKPAARVHVRRTEPSRRTAKILRDIDRGWTIHALTGWHKCSAANIYAIARRHGRTVAASAHGRPRLNLTLTPAGLDAIRAYELVHGLSSTLGGG